MNFTPNNSLAIPHAANTVEILTPNVLKQGDTFNEIRVRLQRENVNVSFTDVTVVWSAAGPNGAIITDRPATIHGNGEISFAFTEEDKGAWGTLRIEFKVTHNVTNKVEKFPANDHVRLHVTRSHDDLTHTPVTFASLSYFNAQVEAAAKSASEASQHALLVEKQGEFAQEQAELAQEAITVATRETDRAAQVSGYLEEKKPLIDKFTGDQTNLQAQVDQLIVEGDSSPAAAQAAVGTDGKVYPTLKARLDTEQKATAQQLADKLEKGQVAVSDIDKNKGLIDQTYISDELKQQISGTAPINSVPADGSLTTQKFADKSVTLSKLHTHGYLPKTFKFKLGTHLTPGQPSNRAYTEPTFAQAGSKIETSGQVQIVVQKVNLDDSRTDIHLGWVNSVSISEDMNIAVRLRLPDNSVIKTSDLGFLENEIYMVSGETALRVRDFEMFLTVANEFWEVE